MSTLLLVIAIFVSPFVLWEFFKPPKKNKGRGNLKKSVAKDFALFRHGGFVGEISDFSAVREKVVFTKTQKKEYEKGLKTDSLAFDAEEKKDSDTALRLRQELAGNSSWLFGVGKQGAYDNAHKVALGLCEISKYDEAFELASSLITLGIKPWGAERPGSYGFYYVETLALSAMSHVCRRQGHLRDAIYQNLSRVKAEAFEISKNKNTMAELTSRPWLSPKPRITDARSALGVRNEIAKILKLPTEAEREIAGLVRDYVDELVSIINGVKQAKDCEQKARELLKRYQEEILGLIPSISKAEMVALTKAFDATNK